MFQLPRVPCGSTAFARLRSPLPPIQCTGIRMELTVNLKIDYRVYNYRRDYLVNRIYLVQFKRISGLNFNSVLEYDAQTVSFNTLSLCIDFRFHMLLLHQPHGSFTSSLAALRNYTATLWLKLCLHSPFGLQTLSESKPWWVHNTALHFILPCRSIQRFSYLLIVFL